MGIDNTFSVLTLHLLFLNETPNKETFLITHFQVKSVITAAKRCGVNVVSVTFFSVGDDGPITAICDY